MAVTMKIEVEKTDGKKIRGILYPCKNPEKNPLVIFSHGFGAVYRNFEYHGKGFAEAGISCLFFDFCGGAPNSSSDGNMEEMTVLTEKEDLLSVIEYAVRDSRIVFSSLILAGESQGGLVSLLAANVREDVRGLVLWYPAFVIPDDVKKRIRQGKQAEHEVFGLKIGADYNRDALSISIEDEQRSFHKPVLLIHGSEDAVVPISYSLAAKQNFPSAELITVKEAGHGFSYPDNDFARNESIRFVKEL